MYFGQYYMCTILSYFILLALRKNKQTNKQKNVGRDTATAVANYHSGPGY